METTNEIEASLPLTAPNAEHHCNDNLGKKIAVYTICGLPNEQLKAVENDLNTAEDASPEDCCLAPEAIVRKEDICEAYESHLKFREEDKSYHPIHFIVADQEDWKTKGILFVNLAVSTDTAENVIGVCRCGIDMGSSIGANLDIANMDWIDFKEWEEEEWGGENPYQNKRYFEVDPTQT